MLVTGSAACAVPGRAPPAEPGLLRAGPVARIDLLPDDSAWQVRIESRVIIRIPRTDLARRSTASPLVAAPPPPAMRWREKKMGKCMLVDRMAGMRTGAPDSVDILTRDGQQIRAYLDKQCSGREFYSGLYIERSVDGKVCVGRDILHSRSGSQCMIDKLRLLEPARK